MNIQLRKSKLIKQIEVIDDVDIIIALQSILKNNTKIVSTKKTKSLIHHGAPLHQDELIELIAEAEKSNTVSIDQAKQMLQHKINQIQQL